MSAHCYLRQRGSGSNSETGRFAGEPEIATEVFVAAYVLEREHAACSRTFSGVDYPSV